MIELKFIKQIEILAITFKIEWDKTSNGGSFSSGKGIISIGTKSYKTDPLYTMNILSHELMEIILCSMGARFGSSRTGENYLFNFDHQTFENAIELHTQALSKFIK